MNRTRTFIALPLSAAVKEFAAQWRHRLSKTDAQVKWVDSENMHLTLKFLGEVPTVELAEICQTVTSAVAEFEPMEIECDHVGAFPSTSRPRTLWLGIGAGDVAVVELQQHLERALNQLGFRQEHRQYHPHITFGRLRSSDRQAQALSQLLEVSDFGPTVNCLVQQVVVVASQLSRDGSAYQRLATIPLTGRSQAKK